MLTKLASPSVSILNFVVIGQERCGASIVGTSIDCHQDAICHGELLHPSEDARKTLHEAYFGPPVIPESHEFFSPGDSNPEQYLTSRVFDQPRHGERAVGLRLPYSCIQKYDLWDYLHDRCLEGDFCVLHVLRNPVACHISNEQAKQTGVYVVDKHEEAPPTPYPIELNPKNLTEHVREQIANQERVRRFCDDRLELSYRELFLGYHDVMAEVFRFLSLLPFPEVIPAYRRLKNRSMGGRALNLHQARLSVPTDVRPFFDQEDLF